MGSRIAIFFAVSIFLLSTTGTSEQLAILRYLGPLRIIFSIAWIALVLFVLKALWETSIAKWFMPLLLLMLYVGVVLVGAVINDVPLSKITTGIYGAFFWLIVFSFTLSCRLETAYGPDVISAFKSFGVLSAILGIAQYVTLDPIVFQKGNLAIYSNDFFGRYRSHGFFLTALHNGLLLIICFVLILNQLIEGRGAKSKLSGDGFWLNVLGLLLVGIAIACTTTRMIYLTFALAVFLYCVLYLQIMFKVAAVLVMPLFALAFYFLGVIEINQDYLSNASFVIRRDTIHFIENTLYYQDTMHNLFGLLEFWLHDLTYKPRTVDNAYVLSRLAHGLIGQVWFISLVVTMIYGSFKLRFSGDAKVLLPVVLASTVSLALNNPSIVEFACLSLVALFGRGTGSNELKK